MQISWPDRQRGVQPICNNDRHTSRMRGYDFGLSVIRTFASKNAACFSLILRTSAGWLKLFTFLEARARCIVKTRSRRLFGFPLPLLLFFQKSSFFGSVHHPPYATIPAAVLHCRNTQTVYTEVQPGAVKLVLWRHSEYLNFMRQVTSENQFLCTRLYSLYFIFVFFSLLFSVLRSFNQ